MVNYPGLPTHPQHGLARRQQKGFGGMVSFERKDAGPAAVDRLLLALRWFTLGESLGGVESLVCHPATMTHASTVAEARRLAGISDGLIRLSVGIEDAGELVEDLHQALAAAAPGQALPVAAEAHTGLALDALVDPFAGGLP